MVVTWTRTADTTFGGITGRLVPPRKLPRARAQCSYHRMDSTLGWGYCSCRHSRSGGTVGILGMNFTKNILFSF